MQTASSSQTPTPPPARGADVRPSGSPDVYVATTTDIAVPQNPVELAALRSQQRQISDQLVSASNRRKGVAAELEKAHDPQNQNGLQARLQVLDGRIARLEYDLDRVGKAIASAPPSALVGGSELATPGGMEAARIVETVVPASLFFVLAMTAMAMWFKRNRRTAPARSKEEADRLDRLEQAVETIAVEMERVSEGQRFVTRLLTEGRADAAPVFGARREAEPVAIPRGGREGER